MRSSVRSERRSGGGSTISTPTSRIFRDIVEKHLVREQLYEIAKAYILYRADREKAREYAKQRAVENAKLGKLTVIKSDGRRQLFNLKNIDGAIRRVAGDLNESISVDLVAREVLRNVYDKVSTENIDRALVLAAASYIERDPAYSFLAARLLLQRIYKEVLGRSIREDDLDGLYRKAFLDGIKTSVAEGHLDEKLLAFDLDRLAAVLQPSRDQLFQYLGIQNAVRTLLPPARRCLRRAAADLLDASGDGPGDRRARVRARRTLARVLCTDVAAALCAVDADHVPCRHTASAAQLVLPHHGRRRLEAHLQMSRRQLAALEVVGWYRQRLVEHPGHGLAIKSTKVESQGVIPFLKIANDVTMAINRSGKRRGATCAYLETWHYDIEDFLDLRKNTGDERRRTHDIETRPTGFPTCS